MEGTFDDGISRLQPDRTAQAISRDEAVVFIIRQLLYSNINPKTGKNWELATNYENMLGIEGVADMETIKVGYGFYYR